MARSTRPLCTLLVAFLVAGTSAPNTAPAQPPGTTESAEPASPLGEPIAIFNVAGVGRVLDDVRWTFESAARNDLNDAVSTVLSAVGDLEGLDRERPLGAMAFMAPGGNGQPLVVGYVPVTDLDKLMASLSIGPIRPERHGANGVWKIENPNGNGGAVYAGARSGYAYFVRDAAQLDIVYPDPARFAKPLTDRYDAAFSVNLDGIPSGLRFLAAAGLRAMAGQAPPQRSGESDEQYALRKEATEQGVVVANRLLNEGRDVTIGFEFSRQRGEVLAEFATNAKRGTTLASDLESIAGAPSEFAAAWDPKAAMSMSLSFTPSAGVRDFLGRAIDVGRSEATGEDDEAARLYVLDVVQAMLDTESTEVRMWTTGGPPRGLVAVSAIRMKNASDVLGPLVDFVEAAAKEQNDEIEVRRNAFEHDGDAFHSISATNAEEGIRRVFGRNPVAFLGSKGDVLWYAVGGDTTAETLKKAMDAAAAGPSEPSGSPGEAGPHRPVMSLTMRAATLMLLGENRDPEFEAIAQRAFLQGGDELKLSLGPKENGFSARFTAAEGWVRLLGLGIAKAYDENQ